MTYSAPLNDIMAVLTHIAGVERLSQHPLFEEASTDMIEAILNEAARMAAEQLAPLNRAGDLTPPRLEGEDVIATPEFAAGYRAIAEGGWIGTSAGPKHGGMGLPLTLTTAVNEMMASACLALSLNPLLTQGQIEALEHHASDEIKALYLPKLISGEWSGTMNLTEAQAGSDVGALRSKAEPLEDGSYAVTGQKIYISWGDHDFAHNICHLVLARLPDAPAGTRGISLFMVPKFIPNADGSLGERNDLGVVSLEHKLGLHGSPTAVMEFRKAKGWMVGAPNKGMAAMFTMMNNARLGVGVEGLGIAERATQDALAYARERHQGASLAPEGHQTGAIIDHTDVRAMLMTMKAQTQVVRALCYDTAMSFDLARATGDTTHSARGAFLTPIAKAFGTDIGAENADLGIQIHGGMGYIEETGVAQHWRDIRVTRIYEGTNGIQGMDLVGRKMMDQGAVAHALLDEISMSFGAYLAEHKDLSILPAAHSALKGATDWMLSQNASNERFAGASDYLRGFALVIGAHYHIKLAMAGEAGAPELAAFYMTRLLPRALGHLHAAQSGSAVLYGLSPEEL